MKKIRHRAVLALLAAVWLTACGRVADVAATEEIVVPEISSKDILLNSLEYLLEEGTTGEGNGEETAEPQTEQSDLAEDKTQEGTEEEERKATAVICYGRDLDSELVREEVVAEEITPELLIGALGRHNIVPLLDTKTLSLEEKETDGRKLLYLDLSGSFREYLMTMSKEAECIIISSIVNTFLINYDADAVYLTVEGETLTTSHTEYAGEIENKTPRELMTVLTAKESESGEAVELE